MGCNYYVKINECKHCGRFEHIHLGKSSCGWKFLLAYNDGEFYKTFAEMQEWLKDKEIFDEYERAEPYEEFCRYVKRKQIGNRSHIINNDKSCHSDSEGYEFSNQDFS